MEIREPVEIQDAASGKWITGRVVRFFQPVNNGCTVEDARGIRYSAPYGARLRSLQQTYTGNDLFIR